MLGKSSCRRRLWRAEFADVQLAGSQSNFILRVTDKPGRWLLAVADLADDVELFHLVGVVRRAGWFAGHCRHTIVPLSEFAIHIAIHTPLAGRDLEKILNCTDTNNCDSHAREGRDTLAGLFTVFWYILRFTRLT